MSQGTMGRVWRVAAAFGFAAIWITSARAASSAPSSVPATGACTVLLDCAGVTQKTVPDSAGKFVFHDMPAGSCTVSVIETTPPEAALEASSSVQRSAVTAPRDAASGMPTGKRQHKPLTFQVALDGVPSTARAAAEGASSSSVSVVVQERRKELTGHVTLIK
jgi:hypothetical protein